MAVSGRLVSPPIYLLGSLIVMGHSREICMQRYFVRASFPLSSSRQEPGFQAFLLPLLLTGTARTLSELHLPLRNRMVLPHLPDSSSWIR